jgi:outer membrane protein OmpA-like peptidoglycan-associated protein
MKRILLGAVAAIAISATGAMAAPALDTGLTLGRVTCHKGAAIVADDYATGFDNRFRVACAYVDAASGDRVALSGTLSLASDDASDQTFSYDVFGDRRADGLVVLDGRYISVDVNYTDSDTQIGLTKKGVLRAHGRRANTLVPAGGDASSAGVVAVLNIASDVPVPPLVEALPKGARIAPKGAPRYSSAAFFNFASAALTPEGKKVVDLVGDKMAKEGEQLVKVTGHGDAVGSAEANDHLGMARAYAVKAELIARGVKAQDIEVASRGRDDLAVPTKDGVREALNRRAEIKGW